MFLKKLLFGKMEVFCLQLIRKPNESKLDKSNIL
jgi:hypothetical protein